MLLLLPGPSPPSLTDSATVCRVAGSPSDHLRLCPGRYRLHRPSPPLHQLFPHLLLRSVVAPNVPHHRTLASATIPSRRTLCNGLQSCPTDIPIAYSRPSLILSPPPSSLLIPRLHDATTDLNSHCGAAHPPLSSRPISPPFWSSPVKPLTLPPLSPNGLDLRPPPTPVTRSSHSDDVYLKLLIKPYKFIGRKTESKYKATILNMVALKQSRARACTGNDIGLVHLPLQDFGCECIVLSWYRSHGFQHL